MSNATRAVLTMWGEVQFARDCARLTGAPVYSIDDAGRPVVDCIPPRDPRDPYADEREPATLRCVYAYVGGAS